MSETSRVVTNAATGLLATGVFLGDRLDRREKATS
jgi:hypothetical protein